MSDSTASYPAEPRDPIELLAEEFLDRYRQGQRPPLSEYTSRHPELADEIRELFPFFLQMESVRPGVEERTTPGGGRSSELDGGESRRLGDYRIVREIGRGGMGVVYEAEQESLGRRVALKVLASHALIDPTQVRRFEREARAAGRLHHTNIVPVFGVGQQNSQHYYVMQYIDGHPLDVILRDLRRLRDPAMRQSDSAPVPPSAGVNQRSLRRANSESTQLARKLNSGRLTPTRDETAHAEASDSASDAEARPAAATLAPYSTASDPRTSSYHHAVAKIGMQVADALAYAARAGILHRDIKPSNLLLDARGNIWIADFGLAKAADQDDLTQTGDIVGTVRYMAPERFDGCSDPRGDVYAVGATLYEMLTLRPAFDEADRARLIERILRHEPTPPRAIDRKVPRDLETIVLKAMAKRPRDRYESSLDLAADLRRFLADESILARRAGLVERGRKWSRRNPAVAGLLLSLFLVFAGGFAGMAVFWRQARWEWARAEQKATDEAKALDEVRRLALAEAAIRARSDRISSNLALDRGLALAQANQVSRGLHWMLEALRIAPDDADGLRRAACANLAAWSRQVPVPVAVFFPPGPVGSIALSPDGKTLLSGDEDGSSRIWDISSGRLLHRLDGHVPRSYVEVAFSSDGTLALTRGTDKTARLWRVADGKPQGRPMTHSEALLHATFGSDGKTVLTTTGDGIAQRWDIATGDPIGAPVRHSGISAFVIFRSDGQIYLTAQSDPGRPGAAILHDAATGRQIGKPLRHDRGIESARFSPDGKVVLTGGWDATARLWNATSGDPIGEPMTHAGAVARVTFSPDGKLVFTGSADGTARLWSATDGRPIGSPLEHPRMVKAIGFSSDGHTIATACDDGAIRIWDLASTLSASRTLPHTHRISIRTATPLAIAYSPDSATVLTGTEDRTVRLWDVATGRAHGPPLDHRDMVRCAAFSPDGRIILSCSGRDVQLWNTATGTPIGPPLAQASPPISAAFRPDGRAFLVGTDLGTAQLWDRGTAEPIGSPLRHGGEVTAVAFRRDGKVMLTGSRDGTVRLWDARTSQAIGKPLKHDGEVINATFSHDGRRVLSVVQRGSVSLWDAETGRHVGGTFSENVWAGALSLDGKIVLTGSQDRTARLWNADTGRPLGPPMEHNSAVLVVAFSPDGRLVVTGSSDKTARIWDAATGKPIGPALVHDSAVRAIAFAPDGKTALTASDVPKIWTLPIPLEDQPDRLGTWLQFLTGLTLDRDGGFSPLDPREWSRLRHSI